MTPRPGQIVQIGRPASVQFNQPFPFRVIGVNPKTTCEGWVYLDGYQLNIRGEAIERRTLFVQLNGVQLIPPQEWANNFRR
jgi:hypothetical protein